MNYHQRRLNCEIIHALLTRSESLSVSWYLQPVFGASLSSLIRRGGGGEWGGVAERSQFHADTLSLILWSVVCAAGRGGIHRAASRAGSKRDSC